MTLQCPLGSLAVDGACKQMVSNIDHRSGLGIIFIITIQLDWSAIADRQVASQLGQTVAGELEIPDRQVASQLGQTVEEELEIPDRQVASQLGQTVEEELEIPDRQVASQLGQTVEEELEIPDRQVASQLGQTVEEELEIPDRQVASQLGQTVEEELEIRSGLHTCGNCSVDVTSSSNARQYIEIRVFFETNTNIVMPIRSHTQRGPRGLWQENRNTVNIKDTSHGHCYNFGKLKSDYDDERDSIFFRNDHFCHSSNRLLITEPVCPSIGLAFSESLELKRGTKKQAFHTFFENVEHLNETTAVDLCTEDYITVMGQTSGSATGYLLESTTFLAHLSRRLIGELIGY